MKQIMRPKLQFRNINTADIGLYEAQRHLLGRINKPKGHHPLNYKECWLVDLTRSITSLILSSLFAVKEVGKLSPHCCESSVARTGQHPWLRPGWKIVPIRVGYHSNTKWTRRFRCADSHVGLFHVQTYY